MDHTANTSPQTAEPPFLSARRSFVVQLSTHVRPDKGMLHGRVEHIVSGHSSWFDSVDQLLAFMPSHTDAHRS